PVADLRFTSQPGDLLPYRLRRRSGEVGAAGVELLIVRQLLRPVLGEVLEEVLARAGTEEEQIGPDPGGTCFPRRFHDRPQLLWAIRDPGKDRRHPDPGVHTRIDELFEGSQPLARMCG